MKRLLLVSALVTLAACVEDVGKDKATAVVSEVPAAEVAAVDVAADPLAVEGATVLTVDKGRSKLGALGAKITAQHPIVFHDYEGRVGLDGEAVRALAFVADVASLESDHPKLTTHLKAEDFLHAEAHPKATFRSTEVKAGAEGEGMTHTVTGDLTIRGKTKRVSFPAKLVVSAETVEAATEFTIDRQDFGVTYPGKKDDLVQDNVVLQVSFVAPRAKT